MSTSPSRLSGSGGTSITPYDPDCETDSEVYVNGTRLPAGDIDIYIRKEGPLDISRYVEGTFASPFRGEDYTETFNGLNPAEQDSFDTVVVTVKDTMTDDYNLTFRGVVTGVGNSSGPEKEWNFRAQGPGLLLDRIPASGKFTDATALDVLKYVRQELDDRLPFSVSLETITDEDAQELTIGQTISRLAPVLGGAAKMFDVLSTPKTFTSNKHSLADVVNWLRDKTGVRIWLTPTTNGVGFIATATPTIREHEAHYLGGNVAVVNNDALSELKPANTVVLKGSAKKSLVSVGPFSINEPQDEYTAVKARHQTLYERAGRSELHAETNGVSDGAESNEVANEAQSILKDAIDEATGGDMQTLLRSPIKPYDTITAKPTCDENEASNTRPLTYEVSRVHHEITGGSLSQTTLNVGVKASMDDIEIVNSWKNDS